MADISEKVHPQGLTFENLEVNDVVLIDGKVYCIGNKRIDRCHLTCKEDLDVVLQDCSSFHQRDTFTKTLGTVAVGIDKHVHKIGTAETLHDPFEMIQRYYFNDTDVVYWAKWWGNFSRMMDFDDLVEQICEKYLNDECYTEEEDLLPLEVRVYAVKPDVFCSFASDGAFIYNHPERQREYHNKVENDRFCNDDEARAIGIISKIDLTITLNKKGLKALRLIETCFDRDECVSEPKFRNQDLFEIKQVKHW